MKNCSHCGAAVNDDAIFCEKCGYSISGNNQADAPSGGFAVLSFFLPLVGLILRLAWSKSPKKAKSCGKGALVGFIVGTILFFAFLIVPPAILPARNIHSSNTLDGKNEAAVLSWYTGIGPITTKRLSSEQIVTVNIAIGYDSDDMATLSELESLQNELRDFVKKYFSEKFDIELTTSNEDRFEREIIEILNSRYLNKAKIRRIRFEQMDVMGDYLKRITAHNQTAHVKTISLSGNQCTKQGDSAGSLGNHYGYPVAPGPRFGEMVVVAAVNHYLTGLFLGGYLDSSGSGEGNQVITAIIGQRP
jgi:flagellar FliL protein